MHPLLTELERLHAAVNAGAIVPDVSPQEIRDYLAKHYDFTKPRPLPELVEDVRGMLEKWTVRVTHPRYFGLFNPSVTLASVVADALVAAYNPQLAAYSHAPGATEIERHTLAWIMKRFAYEGFANFTSGGAEANLTAVVVALTKRFPDYGEKGLRGLAPVFYVTGESHHSFHKIAHMTGLGREAVRVVAVDRDLRMDLDDLARQVTRDRTPFLVVGTAGTTGAGVIDPLPEIARFCRERGLWFHCDAAWGGAAALSPNLRPHLAGLEQADSITCDAHKWFSVPMGAGMFFTRHRDAVDQAFRVSASYMPGSDAPDPYATTAQWSRRFIGLKLFMSLAEGGAVERIEHQARMGDYLRGALGRAGWMVVNKTPLPLVCFTRPGLRPDDFLRDLHRRQIAWMSQVSPGGGPPVVRACLTSFLTREQDIDFVVARLL